MQENILDAKAKNRLAPWHGKVGGTPRENAAKTHCKHGHEFSGSNLRIGKERGGTRRICLTCQHAWDAEWRAKRNAARLALTPAPSKDDTP
jgi:hypothetical protein